MFGKTVIMKIIVAIILSSVLFSTAIAGGKNSKNIQSEFAKKQGAFSMNFSKETLDAFDLDFDWQESMKNFSGDFASVQLLVVSESTEVEKDHKELLNQFNKSGYKIVELDNNDEDITVLTDKRKVKFNEVHILSRGTNGIVLISVYGTFEITNKEKIQ